MRLTILFVLILRTIKVSGQVDSIGLGDLDSLYVRTIRGQIVMALSSGYKYFEVTENTARIKDKVRVSIFKVMTDEELIEKSLRDKKPLIVYRVVHKIISLDTVDINIGTFTVSAKRSIHFNHGLKTKKINFMIPCGGTGGYVPDDRYAFNIKTKTWDKIEFIKPKTFRDSLKRQ